MVRNSDLALEEYQIFIRSANTDLEKVNKQIFKNIIIIRHLPQWQNSLMKTLLQNILQNLTI